MNWFGRVYHNVKPKTALCFYYILSPLSPNLTSKILYWRKFKRPLNLKAPRTLNEKIMWLKLNTYSRDPLVAQCADKWRVREYVEAAGWGKSLNQVYGVWDSASQIPWDMLPNSFVLKCNHGCGYNIICPQKDALDTKSATQRINTWMNTDFWRYYAELQYRSIPKRILCEKYLGGENGLPRDYKVYCFHGRPLYILACEGRGLQRTRFYFFDSDWNLCPITRDGLAAPASFFMKKPTCLNEMLACAACLSKPFPFVRADFYEVEGRLVFGELTFTPSGALDTGRLPETDIMFGHLLKLPGEG